MPKALILSGDDMSFYKFRKELIIELNSAGYEVLMATKFDKHRELLEALGCKTLDLEHMQRRGSSISEDIRLIKEYKRIIKEFKPNVVLTYTLKPRVYGDIAAGKKVPIINTVTGMGSYTLDSKVLAKISTTLDKIALKNANHVFFQNSESRDIYYDKKLLNKAIPTTVVPASGVNLEDFKYLEYPKHNEINFAFVGRIMKDKGVEELFSSAERIHFEDNGVPVKVHMFGFYEENYEEKISELVKNEIIDYHGFVEDIRPFLEQMDCVLLPSYHEGVGNAIQEAAASGRPVIASDIPGCRIVVDDGKTGYLCVARDADSLYEKMKKFISLSAEQREEMGKAGRIKMELEHDRKLVIGKYMDVIKELSEKKSRGK